MMRLHNKKILSRNFAHCELHSLRTIKGSLGKARIHASHSAIHGIAQIHALHPTYMYEVHFTGM